MHRQTFTALLESWYKLGNECTLVQIIPLQNFGSEEGGGDVNCGVGLYSEYTCTRVCVCACARVVSVPVYDCSTRL